MLPVEIQPLINGYTHTLRVALPDIVEAAYIIGSVALEDYQPDSSDLDFVAILNCLPNPQDVARLRQIHQEIAALYSQPKMEGMYLQADHLGCRDGACPPYLNYHDLQLYERNQMALGAVTWWELKHCGITLFGPPAQSLVIEIDLPYLLETQRKNLNTFWASYLSQPRRMITLLSDWGIHWAVLGVSRQFFTLREGKITSKTKAGEYALEHVHPRYHPIVGEAIAIRKALPGNGSRSRLARALEAYRYVRYIIERVNSTLHHNPDG